MTLPRNVLRFEVLLYLSLLLDTLSAAFLDRVPADIGEAASANVNLLAVVLLAFFLLLVWLAARHRKNWARWVLVAALGLSALSLLDALGSGGLTFATAVDVLSTALTAAGLYYSFTGDAKGWFDSHST
ncbi:MAG: hypothetical protein JSS22_16395 [Proteobacteria bacterium]|nr:hypothetical protein [Pseudomonadota bacterium]